MIGKAFPKDDLFGLNQSVAYVDGIAQTDRPVSLSSDQSHALEMVDAFVKSGRSYVVIGGVAGSGKSTIIPYVVNAHGGSCVSVCAYTGKAVMVLKRKGVTEAQTLHHFLYERKEWKDADGNEYAKYVPKSLDCYRSVRLVVVDEASMVTEEMHSRMMELGLKVVYIGDHCQLPPVQGNFNVMSRPDFRMEEVLRQRDGSPVLELAGIVRRGMPVPFGSWGGSSHVQGMPRLEDLKEYDMVITYTNVARMAVNMGVREVLGLKADVPSNGDRMIIKGNNPLVNVFNGQIVYLTSKPCLMPRKKIKCVKGGRGRMRKWPRNLAVYHVSYLDELAHDDPVIAAQTTEQYESHAIIGLPTADLDKMKMAGTVSNHIVYMDYGYAVTCHAAQGSSWGRVAIIDEKRMHWSPSFSRWMYTAITRAEDEVTIFTV